MKPDGIDLKSSAELSEVDKMSLYPLEYFKVLKA